MLLFIIAHAHLRYFDPHLEQNILDLYKTGNRISYVSELSLPLQKVKLPLAMFNLA